MLPPTEFTAEVLEQLGKAYVDGAKMTHAFGGLDRRAARPARAGRVRLLRSRRSSRWSRRSSRRNCETRAAPRQLAIEAGAKLTQRGYHAQVTPSQDGVALFYLNGGRDPIKHDPWLRRVRHRRARRRHRGTDRRSRKLTSEHFSPNVLLRPLVQDTLFPTIAYVGGPSELAYLGQLRGIYDHFGIPMPLIYPRASATIVDAGAARFLAKYEVPLEELQPQDEAALNRLLESLLPQSVEDAMEQAQKAVEERMAAVIQAVPVIDPTLEGAAKSILGKMDARADDAPQQDHPGGQAPRRDPAPSVRPHARTGVSRRRDRRNASLGFVTPAEPLRPRAGRSAGPGAAPRHGGKHWVITL